MAAKKKHVKKLTPHQQHLDDLREAKFAHYNALQKAARKRRLQRMGK